MGSSGQVPAPGASAAAQGKLQWTGCVSGREGWGAAGGLEEQVCQTGDTLRSKGTEVGMSSHPGAKLGGGNRTGQARLGVPEHPAEEREQLTHTQGPREMGTRLEGQFVSGSLQGAVSAQWTPPDSPYRGAAAVPGAPTATAGAAVGESYLGEAEEAGESKFSII